MSDTLQPHGLESRLLCPWNFPGKNTGVGCHFLLQGIFLIQGLKLSLLCLLRWQADSLPLHHVGSPVVIRSKNLVRSPTEKCGRTSLVARGLRLRLPVQGTDGSQPWSGEILRAEKQRKPVRRNSWAWALKPVWQGSWILCALESVPRNKRSHPLPQLEKAHTKQQRSSATRKKENWRGMWQLIVSSFLLVGSTTWTSWFQPFLNYENASFLWVEIVTRLKGN